MSVFLPAPSRFAQTLAHCIAPRTTGYGPREIRTYVEGMAGKLSPSPVWFTQTVTLPLLPGLALRRAGAFFVTRTMMLIPARRTAFHPIIRGQTAKNR